MSENTYAEIRAATDAQAALILAQIREMHPVRNAEQQALHDEGLSLESDPKLAHFRTLNGERILHHAQGYVGLLREAERLAGEAS